MMASLNISIEDLSPDEGLQENGESIERHDFLGESEKENNLTRKMLTEEMKRSGHAFTDQKIQQVVLFDFITSKFEIGEEIIKRDLENKIRLFLVQVIKKYISSCRKYEDFVKNNQDFLSKNFVLPQKVQISEPKQKRPRSKQKI